MKETELCKSNFTNLSEDRRDKGNEFYFKPISIMSLFRDTLAV